MRTLIGLILLALSFMPVTASGKCGGTVFTLTQWRDGVIVEQWVTPTVTYHVIEEPILMIPSDVITLSYTQYGGNHCIGNYTIFFDDVERETNISPGTEPLFPLNEQGAYRIIAYNYWPGILIYNVQHIPVGINESEVLPPILFSITAAGTIELLDTDLPITDMRIFDLLGKVVHKSSGRTEESISIDAIRSGHYVISCRIDGAYYRQRLFIP